MSYEELFARIDKHVRPEAGDVRVTEYAVNGQPRWVLEDSEHVCVYLSYAALCAFFDLYNQPKDVRWDDRILAQDSITLIYADRDELDKEDYALIKSLGRGYRGKKKWPQLRRMRPYRVPWDLDEEDIAELCTALDVLVGSVPGKPLPKGSVTPMPLMMPEAQLNNELLTARFKRLEPSDTVWDVTVQAFPFPTHSEEVMGAPCCPLMLMAVDEKSDQVLCLAIETPDKPECTRTLAQELLTEGIKRGVRPRLVRCANRQALHVLGEVFAQLGVHAELQPDLPQLAEAFESLLNFAGGE